MVWRSYRQSGTQKLGVRWFVSWHSCSRGLLNRFYVTCPGNEEKKRRTKVDKRTINDQGLIGRIPISTNTGFRIMKCCIMLHWNSSFRFHGFLRASTETLSRNSDRCRRSLRLCPKVASKVEVDVVGVFVSPVLREASAHFTWQQWSPGCPTKGAQICGHHFLAQQKRGRKKWHHDLHEITLCDLNSREYLQHIRS